MALFVWNDYYEVGEPHIDHQHRILVNLANRLHDEYMKDLGDEDLPRAPLLDFIEELVDYTELHFAFEEKLMEDAGYPDAKEHKEKHESLLLQLTEMKLAYEQNESSAEELVQFVIGWLTQHILGDDKRYMPFVKNLAKTDRLVSM